MKITKNKFAVFLILNIFVACQLTNFGGGAANDNGRTVILY